jgi:ABC-type multidrug transport system ATPase subunit
MVNGTVADNVRLGDSSASDGDVREALDLVGASDIPADQAVGDDGEGISAGQRRKVAMARAVLRIRGGKAGLLVMDEPTAGLDAGSEAKAVEAVRALGVAALIVSHRPAVLQLADRVVEIPFGGQFPSGPALVGQFPSNTASNLHGNCPPNADSPAPHQVRGRHQVGDPGQVGDQHQVRGTDSGGAE